MAGRLEVRDWVDVLTCDEQLQPFGYLVWAACGKDPGYNPVSLLGAARRLRYSRTEVGTLDFEGPTPDAGELGARWHAALASAAAVCGRLPPGSAGTCVVTKEGQLFRGTPEELDHTLAVGDMAFHEGRIGGAWPRPAIHP
jgi:hypothetical protein